MSAKHFRKKTMKYRLGLLMLPVFLVFVWSACTPAPYTIASPENDASKEVRQTSSKLEEESKTAPVITRKRAKEKVKLIQEEMEESVLILREIAPIECSPEPVEIVTEEVVEEIYFSNITTAELTNWDGTGYSPDFEPYIYSEHPEDWPGNYKWYYGEVICPELGRIVGPTGGEETFYNLDMSVIVRNLKNAGISGEYWEREDGAKMFGNYVMVAAEPSIHPFYEIVPTTMGLGIVCDTGSFTTTNPYAIDVAVTWVV